MSPQLLMQLVVKLDEYGKTLARAGHPVWLEGDRPTILLERAREAGHIANKLLDWMDSCTSRSEAAPARAVVRRRSAKPAGRVHARKATVKVKK